MLGEYSGVYEANRALAFLRSMFNRAINDDLWTGGNPTQGIKLFKEESRDRYLDRDELRRFFKALDDDPDTKHRDYFKVALLTGGRRSNLFTMRWDELNLKTKLWRIPGHKFKNGQPQTIPLVDAAVEILKRRKTAPDADPEWVFPSRNGGPLQDPRKAWQRICKAADLADLRMHDLRRTLGSWQAATGASLPIIGKSLGHKDGSDATAVYARLNVDAVRESVETATAAMLDAANGKDK